MSLSSASALLGVHSAHQRLRRVRLLLRKVVLENLREITLKVFLVESVIRLELFYQKTFQCLKYGLLHQSPIRPAPSEDLPLQGPYVGDQHFVDHIDPLYSRAHTREKLVIGRGILAREEQRRPNTVNRCGTLGAASSLLLSLFLGINTRLNESPPRERYYRR